MIEIIKPSYEILTPIDYPVLIKRIETAGRTCYKSEDKMNKHSAERFIEMLINSKHFSVLEHESISVRIICDRTCSHQLVRHRLCSFSQESQRYCNYNKSEALQVIMPPSYKDEATIESWKFCVENAYSFYKEHVKNGIKPEDARSLLPGCCKTEVVTTCNIRQWRHMFEERCSPKAQWQIRGIFIGILKDFSIKMPVLFKDLQEKFGENV